MEKVGVKIHTQSKVAKITTDVVKPDLSQPFPKTVTLDSGVTLGADAVLFAIGRHSLTDDLGIEKVGVKLEKNGDVVVDEYQTTNVPNIFAIGDVQGKELLTPVAIAAGRRFANRIYGGVEGDKLDYSNVPTVVFSCVPASARWSVDVAVDARLTSIITHSHPTIGTVGLVSLFPLHQIRELTRDLTDGA